jgi:hypothetical protein
LDQWREGRLISEERLYAIKNVGETTIHLLVVAVK